MCTEQQRTNRAIGGAITGAGAAMAAGAAMSPGTEAPIGPGGIHIIGFGIGGLEGENVAESFSMVWSPERGAPSVRHQFQHDAEREAERLAKANHGVEYIVLTAVSSRRVEVPMVKTTFEPPIPF